MSQTKLIEDNMKLVYYIINTNYPTYRFDEDLEQVGMVGLCKAAQTWDGTTSKFSTYACKCITNAIRHELSKRSRQVPQVSLDYKFDDESEDTFANLIGEDVDFLLGTQFESFVDTLSEHEKNILELSRSGLNASEIAKEEGVALRTAHNYIRKLRLKWRKYNGKD